VLYWQSILESPSGAPPTASIVPYLSAASRVEGTRNLFASRIHSSQCDQKLGLKLEIASAMSLFTPAVTLLGHGAETPGC
jgi:hypothetical protein